MATRFTTRSIVPLNLRMPPVLMEGGGEGRGIKDHQRAPLIQAVC